MIEAPRTQCPAKYNMASFSGHLGTIWIWLSCVVLLRVSISITPLQVSISIIVAGLMANGARGPTGKLMTYRGPSQSPAKYRSVIQLVCPAKYRSVIQLVC